MKIGIIGIGDIAKKAYLPILSKVKELEIILYSRNEDNLIEITKVYPGMNYVTSIQKLVEAGVDAVFVHAATVVHYVICKELLQSGIHVYVDKPLSYNLEEAKTLYRLAKVNNLILRVGFNRREIPLIKELKNLEKPDIVIYQKHRLYHPEEIRNFIFDDFIHVVDSLLYLLDDEIISYHVKGKIEDNMLYAITLQLFGKRGTAIGIMNRDSGKSEERIEYICPGEKRIIEDLNTLTTYKNGIETVSRYGDWEPILFRRGFNQVISKFLNDVKEINEYIEEDENAVTTHEICESIVRDLMTSL